MSEVEKGPSLATFKFGNTKVQILSGNILRPASQVDALVSTDDNYLTMGSGVSRHLADAAGPGYVRAAQSQAPVKAGAVVVTLPFDLVGPNSAFQDLQYVLHAAVIDYDTYDSSLEELVYRATANSLERATELGLASLLFPALATGAGGLSMATCAQQMCTAIKAFLARERLLERIYIVLYDGDVEERRQEFLRRANLVLGTPFFSGAGLRQSRSFYGRREELGTLQALLSGPAGGGQAKRHAMIVGGPSIGKGTLLEQLFSWARDAESGRPRDSVWPI